MEAAIPEEQQRRRLEAAERHYQLVMAGKIDDDWYDRYMRENSVIIDTHRSDREEL